MFIQEMIAADFPSSIARFGGWVALSASLALAAIPTSANATPLTPQSVWPKYSVLPILFSPADWCISSEEVQSEAAAIRGALDGVRQFYADSLGGRTFRLNNLEIVQGFGRKEDYHIIWNGKNIYDDGVEFDGNMESAVVEELYSRGYPTAPGQDIDGYNVLIFVKGAGGWAGGRELGNGGWALMGDFFIDSVQKQVLDGEYWWSGYDKQLGAAAHELGHTFGLPHPDAYNGDWETTIMGNWWDYPNLGFNQWELDHLQAHKSAFFAPEPSPISLIGMALAVSPATTWWKRRPTTVRGGLRR